MNTKKPSFTALTGILTVFLISIPAVDTTAPCVRTITDARRGFLQTSSPVTTILYQPSQPRHKYVQIPASTESRTKSYETTVTVPQQPTLVLREIVVPTSTLFNPNFATALTTGSPTPTYTWTESMIPTTTSYWEAHAATHEDGHRYTTWVEVIFTIPFTQPVHGWTVGTSGATELAPPLTEIPEGKLPPGLGRKISWKNKKENAGSTRNSSVRLEVAVSFLGGWLLLVKVI